MARTFRGAIFRRDRMTASWIVAGVVNRTLHMLDRLLQRRCRPIHRHPWRQPPDGLTWGDVTL